MGELSIRYGVGYKTNVESNEYLRCLWSKIRQTFRKLAWNLMPTKHGDSNMVVLGYADIGVEESIFVVLYYSTKGCLSSVEINEIKDDDVKAKIEKCLKEAKGYDKYTQETYITIKLDKHVSFRATTGKYFSLKKNKLTLLVRGYDDNDCRLIGLEFVYTVCSILTFYTFLPVCLENRISAIDLNTVSNVEVIDQAIKHIDNFLSKPYEYEQNKTLLELAVESFSEGFIFERLANTREGYYLPLAEDAVVKYMSALEIISTNDIEPAKCEVCGQMRYSIAKRVRDLAVRAFPENEERVRRWIKQYYSIRSEYVHTGRKQSTRSYQGTSIPLLSINSSDGINRQYPHMVPSLKYDVRNIILFHEGLPIMEED